MSFEQLLARLGAPPGVQTKTCHYCKSIVPLSVDDPPLKPDRPWRIAGMQDLARYVGSLGAETREWVLALFLDSNCGLLSVETIALGSVSEVKVDAGLIITRGRLLGASGYALVHNHPSGDPTPSRADIDLTRQLYQATMYCDLHMLTHVIVARDGMKTVGNW